MNCLDRREKASCFALDQGLFKEHIVDKLVRILISQCDFCVVVLSMPSDFLNLVNFLQWDNEIAEIEYNPHFKNDIKIPKNVKVKTTVTTLKLTAKNILFALRWLIEFSKQVLAVLDGQCKQKGKHLC